MCGAGSDDCAVINVGRQGSEAPGFCEAEEGQDVDSRENGGQRGTLGGAMVEDNFRERFAIKGQRDSSIR